MTWLSPSLGLYIGIDHVVARPLRHRWRRPLAPAQLQLCERAVPIDRTAPLQDALSALLEPSRQRPLELQVVLADGHCRYLALQRPQGLRSRDELRQAVLTRFNALFADETQAWTLVTHCMPGAATDLVVGTRSELLAQLRGFCDERGFRLGAVRPHWFAWSRRWRADLRRGDHWLLCADGGWAGIGYLSGGQCRHLRVLRMPGTGTPLSHLLAREQALHPGASPHASVWTAGVAAGTPDGGVRLVQAAAEELWRPARTLAEELSA